MAAILCQTIGELIGKCCDLLRVPCQYCGKGCDKVCKELLCSPFMPYMAVTFGLNTPAVVYAIKSMPHYSCSSEVFQWLLIDGGLSVLHMLACFYIVRIIREPSAGLPIEGQLPTIATEAAAEPIMVPGIVAETGTASGKMAGSDKHKEPLTTYQTAQPVGASCVTSGSNTANDNFYVPENSEDAIPGGANSFQRIKHVLCYDKGMAIYIIIFLFWVVWMCIGCARLVIYGVGDGDDCGELKRYALTSLSIGYVWMAMVGFAFCCSLLCLR